MAWAVHENSVLVFKTVKRYGSKYPHEMKGMLFKSTSRSNQWH